jgi:hypothetical protein
VRELDGTEIMGSRIVVEVSHGGRRSNEECFACGGRGHWYVLAVFIVVFVIILF